MPEIHPPAVNPCGSCPYRQDVPSGVWSEEEYEKLPPYDNDTGDQPPAVFMCHQQDDRMCAGWTACHDMQESFGVRLAVMLDRLKDIDAVLDYETTVPVFASGAEAAAHGMAEIQEPGEQAQKTVDKLTRRADAQRQRR